MGGHFLWVSRDGWGCVEVYFGWVGVGRHFLWVGEAGRRYILAGWRWLGVSGDAWVWSLVLV